MDEEKFEIQKYEDMTKAMYEAAERIVADKRFGWRLHRYIVVGSLVKAMATLIANDQKNS